MRNCLSKLIFPMFILTICSHLSAHFGTIIPDKSVISQKSGKSVNLRISFSHPFEQEGMDMKKPRAFNVFSNGKKTDIIHSLKPLSIMNHSGWMATYEMSKPGVHIFSVEPEPYFEPAEDIFIIHYTKVIIPAFGAEEGWDHELGLKTEIIPLTRPFGLWERNSFQGLIKKNGKPVPFAEVEIEYFNSGKKIAAPDEYLETQRVKADSNGIFTYTAPSDGWWGFSALSTDDKKLHFQGKPKDVEIGAVLWVFFNKWPEK